MIVVIIIAAVIVFIYGSYAWFAHCVGKANEKRIQSGEARTVPNGSTSAIERHAEWKKQYDFFNKMGKPFEILMFGLVIVLMPPVGILLLVLNQYTKGIDGPVQAYDGEKKDDAEVEEDEEEASESPFSRWFKHHQSYDYDEVLREFERMDNG